MKKPLLCSGFFTSIHWENPIECWCFSHGTCERSFHFWQMQKPLTENEIAAIVVDVAVKIHQQYGPGLLESVYEEIMAYELRKLGLFVAKGHFAVAR